MQKGNGFFLFDINDISTTKVEMSKNEDREPQLKFTTTDQQFEKIAVIDITTVF